MYNLLLRGRPRAGRKRDPYAGEMVAGETEEEVDGAVDLPWIPPELREDRGELDADRRDSSGRRSTR